MTTTATVARDGRALTWDEVLTPAETAAMFGVDRESVARWARSGRLSSVRTPGGHRRYSRAEVLARLAASEQRRTTTAEDAMSLKGITVTHGPADTPAQRAGAPGGHRVPHFDADGDCQCACPGCSAVTARSPRVEVSDCTCPACPCRTAVTS